MFIEEYLMDTSHTTNTGDHRATIDYSEGVYMVNREIDGQADMVAEFNSLEDARYHIEQNYFIKK